MAEPSDFTIKSLSVYEFDNVKARFRGTAQSSELENHPKAYGFCDKWVKQIWYKSINGTQTADLRFQKSVAPGSQWPTQTALSRLAEGVNPQEAGQTIADAMASSGWSARYVLILISFSLGPVSFSALIFTKSATNDTFAVGEKLLLDELQNVYERKIEKAVLYPYYVSHKAQAFTDRAKVYQRESIADFFPRCLGLETRPTPNQLVAAVLPMALGQIESMKSEPSLQDVVMHVTETAHAMNPEVPSEEARVFLTLDGVELSARLGDLSEGTVKITSGQNGYTVTISGSALKARMGDTDLPLQYVVGREGGKDAQSA